jgi:DNA-binding MarR family transcriptional regulator
MVNSLLETVLSDSTAAPSRNERPVTELPGYALRRAANLMMADLATRLADIDLRISEAAVLQVVAKRTDLTSSDIGKILDIQRANMVPLLGRLEAAALIGRKPIDRKSQAVVLTELGQARLFDVHRITARFEDDLMTRIPARHREHFLPALQALTD